MVKIRDRDVFVGESVTYRRGSRFSYFGVRMKQGSWFFTPSHLGQSGPSSLTVGLGCASHSDGSAGVSCIFTICPSSQVPL